MPFVLSNAYPDGISAKAFHLFGLDHSLRWCHAMTSTGGDQARAPDSLRDEAWVWLRLIQSGKVTEWEAKGFKRWIGSSPSHRAAYQAARQEWAQLTPLAGEVLRTDREAALRHQRNMRNPSQGRRAFLGAAASIAAAAGVAAVFVNPSADGPWLPLGQWNADVRTATGEQRTIALAQGVVTLNTATSIRHRTARADMTGGIDLLVGEAAIDLADTRTPFLVNAGPGTSMATGARFEVRYLAGRACVTCIEGSVRLNHPGGRRVLQARQQARYDDNSVSGIAAVEPHGVSAWRSGELVFDNTPLFEVIEEINRYRPGRVALMNTKLRNKPVVGSFYIASLDHALIQLQHTFDLQARQLPGGLLILS